MPNKAPIFSSKHYLVIFLVILGAGLLAASPAFLKISPSGLPSPSLVFSSDRSASAGNDELQENLSDEGEGTVYTYHLMPVRHDHEYAFQPGSPAYLTNFTHADVGCNWMGIAGQVFGRDGNPVIGFTVDVTGEHNGSIIAASGVTGEAQAYGLGGYEAYISDLPFASSGVIQITLRNRDLTQIALPVSLTTYADCMQNLILINFIPK